jgi:CRISPR system Cascade subunit CasA
MTTMNLIADPWIPVIGRDGVQRLVSLEELFLQSANLRDLAVKPHERIALWRLLICIAQAALDGPEDRNAWETCRDEIPDSARAYLRKWKAQFELFGDGARFLQVPNLKPGKEDGEGNDATKLDITLATGHNATIFDNAGGSERARTPAQLALALLTFQCFSPCGIIGAVQWAERLIPKCTGRHAPGAASCMLHTYICGGNIADTIHANLLDKATAADNYGPDGWGKPVWEMMVSKPADKEAIHNTTNTYLGRLVPVSRLVRLDEQGISMLLGNGLDYPIFRAFREAAATVVTRDEEQGLLSASLERSVWRQLSAITVKRQADKSRPCGPLALNNNLPAGGCRIWVGALVTAGNGKIEDVVEAAYDLPAGMFQDTGRQIYEAGVAHAEAWASALGRSVKACSSVLKLQPPPYEKARQHFWTAIEQDVPVLLELTNTPALAADFSATPWGKAVRAAAERAYEFVCSRQTPRQIEAFAKGRQQLFPRNASSKPGGQTQAKSVKTKATYKS